MNPERRFDVTAYGESMIRLSVAPGHYFATATSLDLNVGGAESNVCGVLAQLGRNAGWFSALPRSPLSRVVLTRLKQAGIDTAGVHISEGGRVGTYFMESAYPPLPTTVEYDRAGSAFSQHVVAEEQLQNIVDSRIVHLTGITAALGERPLASLKRVMNQAKLAGALVSFDINYRERLWASASAGPVLTKIAAAADILFCSLRDAVRLFGAEPNGHSAIAALRKATAAELIVVSLGERGVVAQYGKDLLTVPAVPTEVIDRPGAGDALAGAVLDGYLSGDVQRGLESGVALASIVLSHHGDMVFVDRKTLESTTLERRSDISR